MSVVNEHRVFSNEPDPASMCRHDMWIPYFGPVDPTGRPWGCSSRLALVIIWIHVPARDHENPASTGFQTHPTEDGARGTAR